MSFPGAGRWLVVTVICIFIGTTLRREDKGADFFSTFFYFFVEIRCSSCMIVYRVFDGR